MYVRVAKDRPGGVRGRAGHSRKADGTQYIGKFVLSSDKSGSAAWRVEAPDITDTGEREPWQPTGYMQRISEWLEDDRRREVVWTQNDIVKAIDGTDSYLRTALAALVADGYVERTGGSNRALLHKFVKPYREVDALAAEPIKIKLPRRADVQDPS